jgi:chromosome segregation ATPase
MASNQAAELQRAIARAQQEVEELRRAISALENEKGLLQSALAEEKRRVEGMENVVSSTRAKEAAAAEQISRLSRESARLATKLNEADARLEAASTSRKSSRPRRKTEAANGIPVLSEVNNAASNEEGVPAAIPFSKDASATSAPGLSDYLPSGIGG